MLYLNGIRNKDHIVSVKVNHVQRILKLILNSQALSQLQFPLLVFS